MKEIILGIVGPEDLVKRIQQQFLASKKDFIETKNYFTHTFEDIRAIAETIALSCDILLFAGPGLYETYKEEEAKLTLELAPVSVYVRFDGSALHRIFYQLAIENQGDLSRFTPFTIDRLPQTEIIEALREIQLKDEKAAIIVNNNNSKSTNDWANIHEQYFLSGQSKYAITCLTSVANELTLRAVPVKRVEPTYTSIHSALQLVFAKSENLLQSQSQIAVVLLKWGTPDRRPKNRFSVYRLNLQLQEDIIEFCEHWETSLTFSTTNQAMIYTTLSVAKNFTNNFQDFPLIQKLHNKTGNKIFAGIGIGLDTLKAEYNAEQAIQFSYTKTNSCAYVIFTDGQVIGPLLESDRTPLKFSTSVDNPDLANLSQKTNLSPVTITRLLSLMENQEKSEISVHHVAKGFDISLRSARRLLQQLQESGLAKVVGEEQPPGRGRPRQLFRLDFPEGIIPPR